jgi:hypothetical protein
MSQHAITPLDQLTARSARGITTRNSKAHHRELSAAIGRPTGRPPCEHTHTHTHIYNPDKRCQIQPFGGPAICASLV